MDFSKSQACVGTIYARSQSHTCWQGTGSFWLFAIYNSSLPHGIILRAPHIVTAGLNQQGEGTEDVWEGDPSLFKLISKSDALYYLAHYIC